MSNESTGKLNALARQCHEDSQRWFGDTPTVEEGHDLVHHALALCGEAGELANIVKKIQRGSLNVYDPATRIRLASELTDVFIYVLNIAYILKVDLERSYLHVRAANEIRFMKERNERDERRNPGE